MRSCACCHTLKPSELTCNSDSSFLPVPHACTSPCDVRVAPGQVVEQPCYEGCGGCVNCCCSCTTVFYLREAQGGAVLAAGGGAAVRSSLVHKYSLKVGCCDLTLRFVLMAPLALRTRPTGPVTVTVTAARTGSDGCVLILGGRYAFSREWLIVE